MAVKRPWPRTPAILNDHMIWTMKLSRGTNIASNQSGDILAARNSGMYCKMGNQTNKPPGLPAFWQINDAQ